MEESKLNQNSDDFIISSELLAKIEALPND